MENCSTHLVELDEIGHVFIERTERRPQILHRPDEEIQLREKKIIHDRFLVVARENVDLNADCRKHQSATTDYEQRNIVLT